MAHGLNSTKTPARPSHEAIEGRGSENEIENKKSDQQKVDTLAMRGAKRAQNRLLDNEENTPGNKMFTK
ncbi:MAG TPA: hypothetical protein VF865_19435 [Acidobacteriaceae bacterium]